MADRAEIVQGLMRRVHKALVNARANEYAGRACYSVSFPIPGLTSTLKIEGVDVPDLLVPSVDVPESERLAAVDSVIPHLGSPASDSAGRSIMRTQVGRLVMDFALAGATPEERLARLLWAFGKHAEREVGDNTLIVRDASGEYGVRDGVMVGGAYAGTPLNLPMAKLLQEDSLMTTRSAHLTEIRRLLRYTPDPGVFEIACLLCALAEWDKSVLLRTLLMRHPSNSAKRLAKLPTRLLTTRDPYGVLYRTLCPYFMVYGDFVALFGRPEHRGNLREAARNNLINKLYTLPFFD